MASLRLQVHGQFNRIMATIHYLPQITKPYFKDTPLTIFKLMPII